MEERRTQVVQKTVEKTLVKSAGKSKRYTSQSPHFDEVGLNSMVQKQVDSVPKRGKLSGDSGFVTSTPLLSGSPQPRESNVETSFTFSEVYTQVHSKEAERNYEERVVEESFTRLRSKVSKVKIHNHSATPAEKSSPSKSFAKKNNSSIEENIFEDLSKSLLYSNILDDASAAESIEDETDFSLPKGRSLSCPSVSANSDISLNHARWGRFHDWRRQWYLNRWHTDTEYFTVKRWWFSRLFTKIVYILMIIQTSVTTRLLQLKNFISPASLKNTRKVEFHRRTRSSLAVVSSKRYKPKKKPKDFCFLIGVPVILSILAGMLIAFGFLSPCGEEYLSGPAFNLTELGLTNTKYVSLGQSRNIFAWHVLPEGATSEAEKLAVGFPVAFYIRSADSNDAKRKIEIFKILSSAGYNIIIPVFPAAKLNLIEGWKWTHRSFKGSAVYLWGEVGAASDMSGLAKDLCREGFPPNGVIIETELIDETLPMKELEVWTCNCTTVLNDNGSPFTYTHVKCPVSEDNTQKDIIDCLQHLKKN